MKQMKFFLVALLTLVMGMSVTSCMKGDDNTMAQRSEFVRVNQYDFPTSFTTSYGVKLVPAEPITSSTSKSMALISFQYDRATVAEDAKSINVTMLGDPYYFSEDYVSTNNTNVGNAPIVTLEPSTYYGTISGGFFDKNTLILPIAFKYKKYEKEADQSTENALHSFFMTFDSETGFKDGVLTLKLYHNIQGLEDVAEGETPIKRTDNTMDYKAYSISNILSSISGTVTQVKVVIEENQNDDKLSNASDRTYSYQYNFK